MKLYRINKNTVVKIAPFQSKHNIDINENIHNRRTADVGILPH